MANEYGTLSGLKSMLRITDTVDDGLLQSALTAASRAVDNRCGRRFYLDGSPSARTYNPFGRVVDGRVLVDDIGSVSGLVVETGSVSLGWTAVTDYETLPDNAIARNMPVMALVRTTTYWLVSEATRIRVTAAWGWPAVPDEITQATLMLAARLYRRRTSPEGVTGSPEFGIVRVGRSDPDVDALISPYVLPGIG